MLVLLPGCAASMFSQLLRFAVDCLDQTPLVRLQFWYSSMMHVAEMAKTYVVLQCLAMWLCIVCGIGQCAPPRADSHYKLELVAQEPQIVTPIGVAFDREGRLLVVESHTHQRPRTYQGPAADRIRIFVDSDGDGR